MSVLVVVYPSSPSVVKRESNVLFKGISLPNQLDCSAGLGRHTIN